MNAMPRVPNIKNHTVTRRFFLVADLWLAWISIGIAHLVLAACARGMQNTWPQQFPGPAPFGFLFVFSVLVVLFANLRGLYELPWRRSYGEDLKLLADSVLCAGIVTAAGSYLAGNGVDSVGTLALTVIFAWLSMAVWRRFIRSQSIPGLTEKRNVLIVGYGRIAHLLQRHFEENPQLGFVVKGFLCRRRTPRPNDKSKDDAEGKLLGTVDQLPSIVRAHFIDEILICVPSDRHLVKQIARKARAASVPVRVVPDLYDGMATEEPVGYIGQFPTLTLCPGAAPALSLIIKRFMDLLLSGIVLIVLLPLFVAVAILIKLDSRGPVLYSSVRLGKKGVTFVCYKFRTMVEKAEALKESLAHMNERDGVLFKIAADPRVTRVGRYLRKFSIDELPQLWNIFRGEMSLVGPRPPACNEYTQYALEHLRRLDVTPGLTGLWQVTARQDPSFQHYIELDKEYVNNWSLGLDIKILLKTVGVVFAGTGQ
jgi:exopolysaccharide biosynthesis polyprenyl glycosylphosphotransferase